mgnify:CR=1 FL=1
MTKRPWAKIDLHPTAAADDGTSSSPSAADITLYGTIGADLWGDGISAADLARQIADLDVDELNVYVNSPGGAAWDGLAIMNALRRHKAKVTVTVDALAASAASVIAMAGDRIVMNRGSELMIHDASGWCIGNAEAMAETAQVLSKLSDSYAAAYAARAGGNTEDWRARMRAETWYTAEEAVLAGLADEWVDAPPAEARFDMSGFRYRGRSAAPAPVSKLPASEPEDHTTTIREETIIMTDELKDGLRDRLGLAEDVTETAILAALDERLAVSAAIEPPAGTCLVDQAALDDYIWGSAEVIGLMCLAIFTADQPLSPADQKRCEEGARRLGAAFQKINFLRDVGDDTIALGRDYLNVQAEGEQRGVDKRQIVADITADLDAAYPSIALLPTAARAGVLAAYLIFRDLCARLDHMTMSEIMSTRVRVPAVMKARLVARACVQAPRLHPPTM